MSISNPNVAMIDGFFTEVSLLLNKTGFWEEDIDRKVIRKSKEAIRAAAKASLKELDSDTCKKLAVYLEPKLVHVMTEDMTNEERVTAYHQATKEVLHSEDLNAYQKDIERVSTVFFRHLDKEMPKRQNAWNWYTQSRIDENKTDISKVSAQVRSLQELINSFQKEEVLPFVIGIQEKEFISPHFTGRNEICDTLISQIESGTSTILVSGMGGIGKTQLCCWVYKYYYDSWKKGADKIPFKHMAFFTYPNGFSLSHMFYIGFGS